MSIEFSPVVAAQPRQLPGFASLRYIDLEELGVAASPVAVLDDFRVSGLPFSPHPHAGFAAVTYVFQDSPGGVRSRASLGIDLVVGPGGIIWTEAGSGVVHEEIPAVPGRELHGLQIFVNLSSKNKLTVPKVLYLEPSEVPEWSSGTGDCVRVVVGSFEGITSPLVPAEALTLLDAKLWNEISFVLQDAHNVVVYALTGIVLVSAEDHQQDVAGGHAVALHGTGGHVKFTARDPAHFLILSGAKIAEPLVTQGPFIMNEQSQIEAAFARYRSGAMGYLAPISGT